MNIWVMADTARGEAKALDQMNLGQCPQSPRIKGREEGK